jgi:CheY-like chemotaxis protein
MPTILIVDDQSCIRDLISEHLVDDGYQVESAGDAESAKALARSSRPDLVLLDLHLGGPDGWEVLRDVKREAPRLPVIVFTAYDNFQEDPRLSKADGYVIKSTNLEKLKDTIADVLKAKRETPGRVRATSYVPQVSAAAPFWGSLGRSNPTEKRINSNVWKEESA